MLKQRAKLKMKIAILLVSSLLTGCSAVGCSTFHGIRPLTPAQKLSLEKSEVPDDWIRDVKDFSDTYKKHCEPWINSL